jgi:hypothetical protein
MNAKEMLENIGESLRRWWWRGGVTSQCSRDHGVRRPIPLAVMPRMEAVFPAG